MKTDSKKFQEMIHAMLAMALEGNQAIADIEDAESGAKLTIIIQPTGMIFDDADEVKVEIAELVESPIKPSKKDIH